MRHSDRLVEGMVLKGVSVRMATEIRSAKFAHFLASDNVECHFDEKTGIMHIYFDDSVSVEDLPTDAEFMEMFANHRKGKEITGIALFPKDAIRKS